MKHLENLIMRFSKLNACKNDIKTAIKKTIDCFENNHKLLICGNGGSAADSEHIVGELMKGFLKKRPLSNEQKVLMKNKNPNISDDLLSSLQNGFAAISLTGAPALSTAFANDVDPFLIYAQQVFVLGNSGDIFIGISTSGNAENVLNAVNTAKSKGMFTIALTGGNGGKLKAAADCCIIVPESETFMVQELHLPVYHAFCAEIEEHFFTL